MALRVETSYRVVRPRHLKLVHDVLQFVAVPLRAEESLEAVPALLDDVFQILLQNRDISERYPSEKRAYAKSSITYCASVSIAS